MSCAACSSRVEKAVSKVPGVTSCSVSLLTNSMGVDGTASAQEIIQAVEQAGYGASEKGAANQPAPSMQEVEWSKNYRLANDIDFSELSPEDQVRTKSIGTKTYMFQGEFDGNDKKILGLTLTNSDSGLFAFAGSESRIHDVQIENPNVYFSGTAAVLALSAVSALRGRTSVTAFGRTIEPRSIMNAVALTVVGVTIILGGACAISFIENVPMNLCLYETASAFGTVGLTMSLTPALSAVSHIMLIVMMYFGRVGVLTLGVAVFLRRREPPKLTFPSGNVIIG